MPIQTPVDGTWYSLDEAALFCDRARKTVANLVYRDFMPRRIVRGRDRRRRMVLAAETVRLLQRKTLGL